MVKYPSRSRITRIVIHLFVNMSRRDTQWPRAPDIEGATDDNTDPKVGKEKKVKNPYKIPTAACLGTSIPVLSVHVWDVFEALEYCNHQGNDYEGRSFISRKRLEPGTDRLYVIKQHEPKVKIHLSHLRKPSCEQLVTLHHTFRHADSICFVYEEMDASLYQILQIDDHPDTSPDQRRNEIAAICKQVRRNSEHIERGLSEWPGFVRTAVSSLHTSNRTQRFIFKKHFGEPPWPSQTGYG